MTSLRQIDANRRNALLSTGPKTENGKQQSRRNALRHGFTAETVIEPLECPEEYRAFEEAIARAKSRSQAKRKRVASLFHRSREAPSNRMFSAVHNILRNLSPRIPEPAR